MCLFEFFFLLFRLNNKINTTQKTLFDFRVFTYNFSVSKYVLFKVREKQNVHEFFFPFLFFITKAHNMRWKKTEFRF
jgi:hypothetical protein